MAYKYFLIILLLITLEACKSDGDHNNNSEINRRGVSNKPAVKIPTETADPKTTPAANDSIVYVNLLTKFYNHSDFYLPLYFKEKYTEEAFNEITNSAGKIIFEEAETRRRSIDSLLVSKYLLVQPRRVIVFDSTQTVKDTLERQHLEYYEDVIESMFITSYKANLSQNSYVAISESDRLELNKSPKVFHDSTLIKKIITRNNFNVDQLYGYGSLVSYADTLSYLSFGDYKNKKELLYLIKNLWPVDSIINDFVIADLVPVPLASTYELTYMAKCEVPETDLLWNTMLGIDLKAFKFKFYDKNGFTLKTNTKTEDDCIFENEYYALTSAWLKELGIEYFEWIEEKDAAKIPWQGDTLYISKGGCYHFAYSLELRHYNQVSTDSIGYWKNKAIKLAEQFAQKHIEKSLKKSDYQVEKTSNNELFFDIKDDNPEDNLFYGGIKVYSKNNYTAVEMTKYRN